MPRGYDKERTCAYNQAYYQRNREKELERARRYRQANPEVIKRAWLRRRAKKRAAKGSHTAAEWRSLCTKYDDKCLGCGAEGVLLTRDHVIPLSLGGTDHLHNLQPLCLPCNSRKSGRIIDYREGKPMTERMTIQEAARRLGVKEDAIRKRIQRGSLRHEKTREGRVFVWVDATQDTTQDTAEDAYQDAAIRDELVDELRDQVRFLREELARKDAILLRMAESVPQLEAPRESPETAAAGPVERAPPQNRAEALRGAQSAPGGVGCSGESDGTGRRDSSPTATGDGPPSRGQPYARCSAEGGSGEPGPRPLLARVPGGAVPSGGVG